MSEQILKEVLALLDEVLDGGVNDALNLDSHGKTLCFRVLQMPISVPGALTPWIARPA